MATTLRAKANANRERYFNQLASEAEDGLSNNQLNGAFRAIKEISGKASANQKCPFTTRPMASNVPTKRRPW